MPGGYKAQQEAIFFKLNISEGPGVEQGEQEVSSECSIFWLQGTHVHYLCCQGCRLSRLLQEHAAMLAELPF